MDFSITRTQEAYINLIKPSTTANVMTFYKSVTHSYKNETERLIQI